MFRKKINRFRRQFAYEGQEDEVSKFVTEKMFVRGLLSPPFEVELFSGGYPPQKMQTWRGIFTIQLVESEINTPEIRGLLLEEGYITIHFKEPVMAEREGNKIHLGKVHHYE